MTETLCTSGVVKLKAGANISTALTSANYTTLINQAESFINDTARVDYVSTYSGLAVAKRELLQDIASSHAAIEAIKYDMSGFTSRQEALIMINILWAKMMEGINLLKNKDTQGFIG